MKTITGNLWDFQTQVKVIPTNGIVNSRGLAVMGAGVAKQAAARWPSLPIIVGQRLQRYHNRVYVVDVSPPYRVREHMGCLTVVTLPTKDDWREPSSENRLRMSLTQLAAAQRMHDWHEVYMPEPCTGNGGMSWEKVEPILREYLSDAFTVVRLGE